MKAPRREYEVPSTEYGVVGLGGRCRAVLEGGQRTAVLSRLRFSTRNEDLSLCNRPFVTPYSVLRTSYSWLLSPIS
jgi:hypothetical protein